MRGRLAISMLLSLAGCGGGAHPGGLPDAPAIDAPAIDAPPACTPTPLLVGGTEVTQQGWAVIPPPPPPAPPPLTYGADFVQLDTSTSVGIGEQLLLALTNPTAFTPPFKLRITMAVVRVNNHNQLDAAAAIMLSLTGGFGTTAERSQMIYIDNTMIGFADDVPGTAVTANLVDGAFHDYTLAVDAARSLTVTVDGHTLTRAGLTLGGTIAIGDQTNDANVDSSLKIRAVTKLCL